MARTDVADVRDTVKNTASTALDNAKAQASSAGAGLAAAAKPTLDRAAAQGRIAREQARARAKELAEEAAAQGRKARKQAKKRAKELADEAAKSARKRAKKARKRADKVTAKANKNARRHARELSVAVQGRKPHRGRRTVAVLGGLALGGVVVTTVIKRKAAGADPYPPSPTADTGSGLPGDPPPTS
ncbi:MAG TPA: hypothetical protein VGH43_09360 [Jatrophihabitans sp.]|jgi:hypothetical protein